MSRRVLVSICLFVVFSTVGTANASASEDWSWCTNGTFERYHYSDIFDAEYKSFEEGLAAYNRGDLLEAARIFRVLAANGSTASQKYVAVIYEELRERPNPFGSFRSRQCKAILHEEGFFEALQWWLTDSDDGDAKAIPLFTQLASRGHTLSKYYLGQIYIFTGSHRGNAHYDPAKGAQLLLEALKEGIPEAKSSIHGSLPWAVLNRCLSDVQKKQGYSGFNLPDELFSDMKTTGNKECRTVASVYLTAKDLPGPTPFSAYGDANRCNSKSGLEKENCFQKLVYEGNVEAYCDLSKYWFEELVKAGDSSAAFFLGVRYQGEDGKPLFSASKTCKKTDYKESNKWYLKAAELGDPDAQYNLALAYAKGKGVGSSGASAADWFYKAGQAYLKNNQRERALQCVERIKGLKTDLNLSVPNMFLADKLMNEIYGGAAGSSSPNATEHSTAFGTGWLVSGNYVVTNHHVIDGHSSFHLLLTNGEKVEATVALADSANDLALLKIKGTYRLPPALTISAYPGRIGDRVFTIGYPHPTAMGAKPKLTDGIISSATGLKDDPRTYQISVPVQAGNSGGPLLNMYGEVVGVVTSKLNAAKVFKWTGDLPQNVNYAVKAPYLSVLLSSAPRGDRSSRLSIQEGDSLADLAAKVQDSVMIVIAE
ncbi:MAG TPA: tetratricopeptide repeat-containing serine protease family protein [Mariprofundaceae bacterium]|nr:tetratricopeptide repeat-containing serine protease family protein [Mariprofundaceae bacterium]